MVCVAPLFVLHFGSFFKRALGFREVALGVSSGTVALKESGRHISWRAKLRMARPAGLASFSSGKFVGRHCLG